VLEGWCALTGSTLLSGNQAAPFGTRSFAQLYIVWSESGCCNILVQARDACIQAGVADLRIP
jgi:hypothetical protein